MSLHLKQVCTYNAFPVRKRAKLSLFIDKKKYSFQNQCFLTIIAPNGKFIQNFVKWSHFFAIFLKNNKVVAQDKTAATD